MKRYPAYKDSGVEWVGFLGDIILNFLTLCKEMGKFSIVSPELKRYKL